MLTNYAPWYLKVHCCMFSRSFARDYAFLSNGVSSKGISSRFQVPFRYLDSSWILTIHFWNVFRALLEVSYGIFRCLSLRWKRFLLFLTSMQCQCTACAIWHALIMVIAKGYSYCFVSLRIELRPRFHDLAYKPRSQLRSEHYGFFVCFMSDHLPEADDFSIMSNVKASCLDQRRWFLPSFSFFCYERTTVLCCSSTWQIKCIDSRSLFVFQRPRSSSSNCKPIAAGVKLLMRSSIVPLYSWVRVHWCVSVYSCVSLRQCMLLCKLFMYILWFSEMRPLKFLPRLSVFSQ